jgi:hypothetical protein
MLSAGNTQENAGEKDHIKYENMKFRNRHPIVLIESVFNYEDQTAQLLSIIRPNIYHTTTRFGPTECPSSGSLQIRTKGV